jgi:hypothetical protein
MPDATVQWVKILVRGIYFGFLPFGFKIVQNDRTKAQSKRLSKRFLFVQVSEG